MRTVGMGGPRKRSDCCSARSGVQGSAAPSPAAAPSRRNSLRDGSPSLSFTIPPGLARRSSAGQTLDQLVPVLGGLVVFLDSDALVPTVGAGVIHVLEHGADTIGRDARIPGVEPV